MQYPSLAGNVIHSLVLPEWISGYEKYTLYPRMTQQKSSQPVYWENTMNNRNPKSDWLEYELVSYLNPHDLKSFEKINKRLKRLTSGLATTWEESESEKMLGVGKRKKIPSSKLQDAAALVVEKPRRGNPKKVTNTTTENEGNNQPSSSIIVHRFESGSPFGRNNSGNAGGNLPNVPFVRQSDNGSPVLTNITTVNGNNLPFFPFVHPTDDRLWPPYAPNNTTTGNDFVARGR
ncbi:uncharacterized protein LOC124203351 isoform X2 [Daphnia pulex]|uniref:uncharacterized protein LOC124203351 isoform X2 n=1 Tax=Daphnia pulex TaxID=6669 RepID=UPI001EE03E23|nr:uncharacterized protein LOC124203351 isoform X2 [Daphnia pulex]